MPQIGDTEIFEVAYYDSGNALIVPNPAPTITIISPTGTTLVNAANMTQLGTSAVFKYEYTYAANGSHKWYTTTADTDASPASTPMLSIVVTAPPDVNVVTIATNALAEIADAVLEEVIADHDDVSGGLAATIAAIRAKTELIGTGSATIRNPVTHNGNLELTWGEDYAFDLNTHIEFDFPDLPSFPLTETTYVLTITDTNGSQTYITASGTRQTSSKMRFELLLSGAAEQRTTSLPKPTPRELIQLPFRIAVVYPEGTRIPIAYKTGTCFLKR